MCRHFSLLIPHMSSRHSSSYMHKNKDFSVLVKTLFDFKNLYSLFSVIIFLWFNECLWFSIKQNDLPKYGIQLFFLCVHLLSRRERDQLLSAFINLFNLAGNGWMVIWLVRLLHKMNLQSDKISLLTIYLVIYPWPYVFL